MSDLTDDDVATSRLAVTEWIPPVDSVDALPRRGVNEGTFCWVQAPDDEATWQFRRGEWVRIVRSR